VPTRASGDSPADNPPRRSTSTGRGRHSAGSAPAAYADSSDADRTVVTPGAAPEPPPFDTAVHPLDGSPAAVRPQRRSHEAPVSEPPAAAPSAAGRSAHGATRAERRRAAEAAAPRGRASAKAAGRTPAGSGEHRGGATRGPGRKRRVATKPVLAGVVLLAVAAAVQFGVKIQLGTGDSASAALASQFTVANGAIRKASGTPTPTSGSQASLWGNTSTATTTIEGSGRVLIGAIGDECGGWPTVEATEDGRRLGATTIVSHTDYGTYGVGPTALPAGTHKIVLRFVNDRYDPPTCDRNVHIGYARMEFPATADPAPIPPVEPPEKPIPTINPPMPPSPTPSASATAKPTSTPTTPAPTSTAPTAAPPTGGKPGPGNTGVPAGTKLTVHNGDLTVSKDGTVIDALDIRGFLKIEASNVTVKRTIIRGGVANGPGFAALVAAYGDHKNFVIEDSTLVATNPSGYMDGLKGRNFTATRLDISNVVDTALVFGDNVTVQNSWFHGNRQYTPWPSAPDNKTHNDSLQIQGGTNIVVRGNTFEQSQNTAMMITQDYSRTSNVQIIGNWLSGGQCTINLSEKGKGPITNFRLSHNRFGTQGIKGCAVIAPDTSRPSLDGDVWDATGQPITISKGT
jgi:hypothetical protein